MKRKWIALMVFSLAVMMLLSSSVFAFGDLKGFQEAHKINHMLEKKIISGIDKDKFAPRSKVSYGMTAVMLVKAFDLNIDHIRFIKEPKASDYFTNVKDNAWYSNALVIAHLNGIPLPKDLKANDSVTREEFAHYLMKAIGLKGEFMFTQIYFDLADEDQVNPDYMGSIQTLLNGQIIKLGDNKKFYPKDRISRYEAAIMIYNALELIEKQSQEPVEPNPVDPTVTFEVVKVNDDVNKVIVSWGEKPHPGYGISIDKITFEADNQAVVYYTLHYPNPDMMYPMVIVNPQAEAFVGSNYQVSIQPTK